MKREKWTSLKFEAEDGFVLVGLIMLGAGLWLYAPWVSLTVVGAVLFALGAWTR